MQGISKASGKCKGSDITPEQLPPDDVSPLSIDEDWSEEDGFFWFFFLGFPLDLVLLASESIVHWEIKIQGNLRQVLCTSNLHRSSEHCKVLTQSIALE